MNLHKDFCLKRPLQESLVMETDNEQNHGTYALLNEIFGRRGFDFNAYGVARIQQILSGRMSTLEIPDLYSYKQYIISNPQEYSLLFNAILIDQNQFFREPSAYDFIKIHVLPKLLSNKQEIRIWSAGCGSGEEPYSVAILLSEVLKEDLNRYKIKIFATDINESTIKIARGRIYHADKLTNLPQFMKDNYFSKQSNLYTISDKIRNMVVFGKHNIISDPPIPYIDLLICRDVLIYLEPNQRLKAIFNICNALNYNGYLWIGSAEKLMTNNSGLKPLNTKWHIFKKVSNISQQNDDLFEQSQLYTTKKIHSYLLPKTNSNLYILLLDENYRIIYYDQNISKIFMQFADNQTNNNKQKEVLVKDISGKTIFDLYISQVIPDLKAKLNCLVNEIQYSIIDGIEYWINKDERILLKLIIVKLKDRQIGKPYFILIFLDVTEQYELNTQLQITISALDMANKKLISTNEELKTMAKGLETINQYLQSENTEEFIELNEKLIRLNNELNSLKENYALLIRNIDSGIIIVDKRLLIRSMNSIAENILGTQSEKLIKKPLSQIDTELARLAEQVGKTLNQVNYTLNLMNKYVNISINPIFYENNLKLFLILNERG